MFTFILGLTAVVAVLSSLLLVLVILIQEPKGGGIAAALGGSGMEALGVATGGVNKFTSWVAGVWIAACLAHAVMQPAGATFTSDPGKKDPATVPANNGNGGGEKSTTPPDEGQK